MKAFLAALKAVSNVNIAVPDGKSTVPEAWQLVLARALVALVWVIQAGNSFDNPIETSSRGPFILPVKVSRCVFPSR